MPAGLITVDNNTKPLLEQLDIEKSLIKAVRQDGIARIHIWHAENTLVVTKPESRLPHFIQAQKILQISGWPIVVRDTGGTAVPQSPDTLNISMLYKAPSDSFSIDASYALLCQPIMQALASLGITATAGTVEGSFCDGKYNLAVQQDSQIKKIVGTSQKWTADKIVLAHAVILSSIDTDAATDKINHFYTLAGSTEKKQANAVTSIQTLLNTSYTSEQLRQLLTEKIVAACESLTFQ